MVIETKTIIVDGFNLNIVFGHKKSEWITEHKNKDSEGELWDFPIEELLNGAIEPNEEMWYWLINGRLYETFDLVDENCESEEEVEFNNELQDKIIDIIGDYYSELEIEERLTEFFKKEVSWYDGGVDDGSFEDDDEYVMKACFEVIGTPVHIRVYYGDCTHKIGYVSVTKN